MISRYNRMYERVCMRCGKTFLVAHPKSARKYCDPCSVWNGKHKRKASVCIKCGVKFYSDGSLLCGVCRKQSGALLLEKQYAQKKPELTKEEKELIALAESTKQCQGCHYWKRLDGWSSGTGRKCCHYCVDTGSARKEVDGVCLSRREGGL